MTDHDELKRLAEAAKEDKWSTDNPIPFLEASKKLRNAIDAKTILSLLSELEECKRDAERYRWIRSDPKERHTLKGGLPWPVIAEHHQGIPTMIACYESRLDFFIDAAIATAEGKV